jgi:phospholipid/cholesterol/gamma-HCH transport system substrate-binding protein
MIKQAPPVSRIVAMAIFALSCFGILLYLWTSFGGNVPLKPQGYRFDADLTEATLLVNDADVRISGVNVGRVAKTRRVGRFARATIEMQSKYAPIPKDTRLTLRQKTLGGETYVELSPGDPRSGLLPESGRLPSSQARETAEIDEVLSNVFDAKTRNATKRLLIGLQNAFEGRSEDFNDALGHLGPFAVESGRLLRVIDRQRESMRRLVRDGGFVLSAAGRRQGELSSLVRAGDRVLATTARRNAELEETVRILPTTLRELRPTFGEIEAFSREAAPVLRELRPAGRELGPALVDAAGLAPDLRGLFRDVDEVIDVSKRALPATTRTVNAARPVFGELAKALRDLLPVVDFLGLYETEVVQLFAGAAAGFQYTDVTDDGSRRHFFRALIPFGPEGLVGAQQRFGTNRHNPYPNPRWLDDLATGLESIDCENTGNTSPAGTEAPEPCKVQPPFRLRGRATAYPQIKRDP